MASEPLVFRGRLSEDDVCRIQRYLYRLVFRRPFRWLGAGVATLVAVGGIWWAFETGTPLAGGWFLLVWFGLVVLIPLEQRRGARRHYRRYEAEYLETEVTLGTEWIRIENDAMRSQFKWSVVELVIDAPEGLLFCDRANQCLFWLPERILDDALRQQVLDLAGGREVAIRRMS